MPPASARNPGDRVGPYELVERLGVGGMGEVWEAMLHGPGGFQKRVALKLLLPSKLGDPVVRHSLLREARLGARLQHPNVMGTLGVSEHEESWVVALELVKGASASTLAAATGPLPPLALLDVGVQAAAGLAHAHDAGLIHRDIKPANLLVDRSGLVKIGDLGISLVAGESGQTAGTIGYMAPEQADGQAEARSDLFSLGATLYRLATGRHPFGNDQSAVLWTERADQLVVSSHFLQPLEGVVGLGAVLARCLRIDPRARYPSAHHLGEALAALRSLQASGGPTLLDLLARVRPDLDTSSTPSPASQAPTRMLPFGNLARPRDRFIGRAEELEMLLEQVRSARHPLLTLLGPGGAGKTRLAVETARRVQHELHGGAWAIDLSEARSEEGICGGVAAALGIELGPRDPVGQLGRAIDARGRTVLVLDNLEQCVEHLPRTVGRWLDRAPEATLLCTSRVLLELRGEHVVTIGPVADTDAVELFEARAPRPVRDDERSEVEALCEQLEGMPLAIELAAARTKVMDVHRIRERLSLSLLSGGGHDRPERHRSVAASLDWSVSLLPAEARRGLGHLSVFEGGFTLEAAESVLDLDGAADAVEVLSDLADASLVRVAARTGRFSMLVVVREYAAIEAGPERAAAELRHGEHFAQHGSRDAVEALALRGGTKRLRQLEPDLDNLVSACRRAVDRADGPIAVRTLRASWAVFETRGPYPQAAELAEQVAATAGLSPRDHADVLTIAGKAFEKAGDAAKARARLEAALALLVELGDRRAEAAVLGTLGFFDHESGRSAAARKGLQRSLDLAIEAGDPLLRARALNRLGDLERGAGHLDQALARLGSALALARQLGCRPLEGAVLGNLSLVHVAKGEMHEANERLREALVLHQELGNRSYEAWMLQQLGGQNLRAGALDESARYYRGSLELFRELGERRWEARVLGNLGTVYLEQGRLEAAQPLYEQALALHRELESRRSEGHMLGMLATLYQELGRLEQARECYQGALDIHRAVGNTAAEALVSGNVALLHMELGQLDEAEASVARSLELFGPDGGGRSRGFTLSTLGRIRTEQKRLDEAETHLDAALAVFRSIGDQRGAGFVQSLLAQVHLAAGDLAKARELLEAGERLLRHSNAAPLLAQLLTSRAEVEHLLGAHVRALEFLKQAEALAPPGQLQTQRGLERVRALLAGSRPAPASQEG